MNDELYNELFNQQMQQLNGNNTSIDTPLDQLNSEQATEAGLFHPEEEQTQPQEETQEEPPFKENTTFGERLKDVVNVSGREFARMFVPKALEDDLHLTDYKPKTRAGQASLYYTRYLWGASGLALGGEVGAGIKAAGVAANAPKAIKAGDFLAKTLGAENLIKTGSTNAFKKAGVWTLNKATQGLIGGALLDWNLYDPDEDGHLADMFGKTDNAFISYLQTDEDDSELEARFKNVVEGAVLNMGFNVALDVAKPLVGGMFKGIKKLFKANTTEEAVNAAKAVGDAQVKLERVATVEDLWDKVDELTIRAEQTGEELDQLLIDNIHPSQLEDARKMGKMYLEGDEPFIHSDGTWDISVSKWDDAYKVSPEEYQKQLRARDEFNAVSEDMVRYGDTAIQHQNQAVKDTWVNRGWIGADEELTAKNAQKIVKNYTDKFEIDNNIKVEFVDGLHIKGQAVEGNTTATKYQGKITKSKQNAIDKQKLKISKLEDKITMAEGGNKAVKDPVDNLKEELRIAKNELKELEKEAKGKNRIPDITIQIDTKAQNPYATLRAEIEHARDIAKGEVPNQKVQHFSRYQGMNEAEVAPQYTYKKSQGKARATSQNVMNDGQIVNNELKYNQGDILNEQTTTPRRKTREEQTEAIRRFVSGATGYNNQGSYGDGLFIRRDNLWVVNDSKSHLFDGASISKTSYKELPQSIESGKQFINALKAAKKNLGAVGEQVDIKTAKEYANAKTFLSEDGLSGVAVSQDGEIMTVFVDPTAKVIEGRGRGRALIELGKQNGGTHLNCYDTDLPVYYQEHGFTEYKRDKWNDDFWDKKNWKKENHLEYKNGEPDIVYMKLNNESEQLKLDFNSKINEAKTTEEVIDNMLNNPEAVKSYGDVENIINKTIELDPSISGWTFKELAEGGDKTAEELFRHLGDENIPNYKELLNNGDYEALNKIAQKELGASKTLSALYDKVDMLASDATKEQKKVIIDTIHHITDYVNQLRSGSGALLNAQKFVNKALDVFGSMRLSELSRDGIRELSDILQETVEKINLNFTRGNVVLAKQQIMKDLYEKLSPEVFDLFTNDKQFAKGIDEVLNNMLKKEKLDPSTVYQQLEDIFTETLYDDVVKAVKAAPTEEGKTAVVKNWMNQQGGLKSFYIHNLLSGAGTLSKNVLSGGINTLYFPAKKILGGIISKNPAMTREGWNTYKLMLQNMGESWRMCCQAFKNGEGKLVNLGTDSLNMGTEDAVFSGFREWKVPENMEDLWHQIQNLHSVMTRAMGASDEFMTQLNYRSITRAKCLEQATELAEKAGMANNEKWINEQADKLFTTKFNKAGQPLDTEAYNEARSILYQDNLDGTQLNLRTGEKQQMREQTLTMKAAEEINNMANGKFGFMKFMFPFVKTGANILQQNLDHNALYALFSPAAKRRLKSDPKAVAEVIFGTTSFLMCSLMALNGNITGSAPVDPKEAKALFETGWRPYSIKRGDKYWSYQGYEPIHTMLGFAADGVGLYQAMTDPNEIAKADVAVQQGMAMLVNNFLDKAAFRTGLKQLDLIMNPNDTDEWKKAMAQTVSGMLPASSFVKNVSTLGTREAKTPKTFSQRIFNNYFNRGLGEYRRDVFGEKQTITNAILSTAGQDTSDIPEYQALAELAEYGYSPSEIRETIANSNISYRAFKNPETNQNAYDAMQDRLQTITIDGKTLREAVRELVTSQEYQEMMIGTPDKDGFKPSGNAMTKMNAIKDIFREYNQEAERQVLSESDIFLNNKGQSLEEYKEEIELKKEAVSNGENLDDIGDKIISTF